MKKIDRLINLEVARVLLIKARNEITQAKERLADAYGLTADLEHYTDNIDEAIGNLLVRVVQTQETEK